METLPITTDWVVQLETPRCDLGWHQCTKDAGYAFRLHGCAFYYSCRECYDTMADRLGDKFGRFAEIKCLSCGLEYNEKNYVQVIPL